MTCSLEKRRKMETEKDIKILAECIETLCSVEMRQPGPGYGVIRRLYESGRDLQGGLPTALATEKLVQQIEAGDVVIIATGAYLPHFLPKGETDGPIGAASLAYSLNIGLGATPLILCGEEVMEPMKATCHAMGLGVRPLDTARAIPFSVAVESFPADEQAEGVSDTLLASLKPKAVICIEALGVNSLGYAHSSTGVRAMEGRARFEVLVKAAQRAGILTIGIGDNGNEIGFGLIEDAVRRYKPYGTKCRCDCGGGIACATSCDILIVAAVSNWGAYGLSACLAGYLEQPDLIHDSKTELRMIDSCVRTGAVDGGTGMYTLSVDGIPGAIHGHIVEMLGHLVQKYMSEPRNRAF
jgi:D-glutamate cyclase